MTGYFTELRGFDPVAMTAPVQEVTVPARFIETFMVVADVCLNQDPLDNKAVPTSRFKKLWGMVEGGAPWNQRYFQIVRDRLDRMGVIKIFDRNHSTGKAWRWEARSFPTGNWKEDQRKSKHRLLAGPALSVERLAGNAYPVMNNRLHNSLYEIEGPILGAWGLDELVRPPP
jgi:hypothetical protein